MKVCTNRYASFLYDLYTSIHNKYELAGFDQKRLEQRCQRVHDRTSLRRQFVELLCPEGCLMIGGCALAVHDRDSLWALSNEILYREQYYFECAASSPLIYDLGANIGMALFYFKRCYPESRIRAFEPDPVLFGLLEQNISENGWTNIEVYPYALNGTCGEATFYQNKRKALAGSLTERRLGLDDIQQVTVTCKTLSSYLSEHVDFLKMDIEGLEDQVLAEIESELGSIDRLFVEYHQGQGLKDDRLLKILQILNNQGFDYYVCANLDEIEPSRHPMRMLPYHISSSIWARRNSSVSS